MGLQSNVYVWEACVLVDNVFVSVYAITETNTTAAKFGTSGEGSSPCFGSNGTLLCGRTCKFSY